MKRTRQPWERSRTGFVLAGVVALSAVSGPARADDWLNLGQGETRARISNETSGARFDAGGWRHEWTAEPKLSYRALLASPAVGDGHVAFATQRNTVRVLRETDGQLIWEAKAGSSVFASPAIWRGLVFVLGLDQTLTAFRLADGAMVWRKDLGAMAYASPVVVDGDLFVATGIPTPRLLRIDAGTGQIRWEAGAGVLHASALASVAVSQGHVLVGELEGRYHSFSTVDGRWQWTAATLGRVALSSPLIVGDRVYLLPGGDQAQLHAVDLATGAALPGWPLDLAMPDPDASLGPARPRRFVTSSPAGGTDVLTFSVRVDDAFGADGNGDPTAYSSDELLFAVDGSKRRVLWSAAVGRLVTKNANTIPGHEFLPSPALLQTPTGEWLIAATSSLAATVRVFARNGDQRWTTPLSAPTRSSPVFANGRLFIATDAGIVHAFLSGSNQPPQAPVLGWEPPAGADTSSLGTTLRWGPALDPEGQPVTFQVRIDDDGEILRDWDIERDLPLGERSLELPALVDHASYTFAVRARDPQGAWSAWSERQTFRAVTTPVVTVDERPAASLAAAIAAASAGSVIRIGAGVTTLTSTLQLPPGTSLVGAGPHLTTLNAPGLAVGVAPGAGSQLSQLTVTGAHVGIRVDGAQGVNLHHLVLRDNDDAGLDVTASGSAQLISATVFGNGSGVRSAGATLVRNALITANRVGLAALRAGGLSTQYNDAFGNRESDYGNVDRAATDLAVAVEFAPDDHTDLRLRGPQLTTDRGDPADDFSQEPAPNGGRINIGAFGNTPFAELSAAGVSQDDGGAEGGTTTPDGGSADPDAQQDMATPAPGCTCHIGTAAAAEPAGSATGCLLLALGLALRARRRRKR